MKKGYVFGDPISFEKDNYKLQLRPLVREQSKEVAGILFIYENIGLFKAKVYMCIPIGNPALTEMFIKDVSSKMDPASLHYYTMMTTPMVGSFFQTK